jgi:transcriptional regulator with XRE-family HTH domain
VRELTGAATSEGTTYQRLLGDELRAARRALGWTRRDLQRQLGGEVSLQTLATYELGSRACTVRRLVELCMAMGQPPHELLGRAHRRACGEVASGSVTVPLASLATDPEPDDTPELTPLRRWARGRLAAARAPERITLDPPALEQLSVLCRVDTAIVAARLRALSAP